MEHDINNRKEICQSTGTLLHAPKFGELWSGNGWERMASFCPPPKFSHWETLPALPHVRYITDSRQTLAHVMYSGTSFTVSNNGMPGGLTLGFAMHLVAVFSSDCPTFLYVQLLHCLFINSLHTSVSAARKLKKGMATAKQRLGKKLKIHKMIFWM